MFHRGGNNHTYISGGRVVVVCLQYNVFYCYFLFICIRRQFFIRVLLIIRGFLPRGDYSTIGLICFPRLKGDRGVAPCHEFTYFRFFNGL